MPLLPHIVSQSLLCQNLPTQPLHPRKACSSVPLASKPTISFLQVSSQPEPAHDHRIACVQPSIARNPLSPINTYQSCGLKTHLDPDVLSFVGNEDASTHFSSPYSHWLPTRTTYIFVGSKLCVLPGTQHPKLSRCISLSRDLHLITYFHAQEICHVYRKPYHEDEKTPWTQPRSPEKNEGNLEISRNSVQSTKRTLCTVELTGKEL